MTDPIAPDALREAVHAALRSNVAVYHLDTITHDLVASIGADTLTDAVLAEVAKHRDAEVERLRAELVNHKALLLGVEAHLRVCTLPDGEMHDAYDAEPTP